MESEIYVFIGNFGMLIKVTHLLNNALHTVQVGKNRHTTWSSRVLKFNGKLNQA